MTYHNWVICPTCNGEGRHSRNLSPNLEEADDDFVSDYMTGAYDGHCVTCGGSGKVCEEDLVVNHIAYRCPSLSRLGVAF